MLYMESAFTSVLVLIIIQINFMQINYFIFLRNKKIKKKINLKICWQKIAFFIYLSSSYIKLNNNSFPNYMQ